MQNAVAGPAGDRLFVIYRIARTSLAMVWIYHGLVPKFLFRDWSEMNLLGEMGVDILMIPSVLSTVAYLEMAFGVLMLANWRSRWPLWATIGAMAGGLLSVIQHSPRLLHAAFNPVSLNGLMIVLAVIALIARPIDSVVNK